jgi:hypothetical protein
LLPAIQCFRKTHIVQSGVKTIKDLTPQVLTSIRAMANTRVMVGVPAENAFRAPDPGETVTPPNNAEIGYINEFGDPASHIPPRPFLVPAMEAMQPEIIDRLHKIADAAIAGRGPEAVDRGLHVLGLRAQAAVRKKITDGPFAPLAPYTIWKRQNRKAPRMGTKPLIDTGALRRSINYAIRRIRALT